MKNEQLIAEVNDVDRLEQLRIQARQKVEQIRTKLQDVNGLVKDIKAQKKHISDKLSEKVDQKSRIERELKEETENLEELNILKPGEKTLEELRKMFITVRQFVGDFAVANKNG